MAVVSRKENSHGLLKFFKTCEASMSAQNRFVSAQKKYFHLFDRSETIYEHSQEIFFVIKILHS